MNNNSHKDLESKLKFKDIEEIKKEGDNNIFRRNREYIICIGIIFVMLIGIVAGIKILSVTVPSNEEIKNLLLDKELNIDDVVYRVTEGSIEDVKIINRITKKDVSDCVDLRIVLNIEGIIYESKGTVDFVYNNGEWQYNSISKFNKITKNYTDVDFKEVVTTCIKEEGIINNDGNPIPKSFIEKINNIKFNGNSYKEDREFSAELILYNGVCFQNCDIKGETKFNNETGKWSIINTDVDIKNRVLKNGKINEKNIKNEVIEEILIGGIFKIDDSIKTRTEFLKLSRDDLIELNISDYVVRKDNSIRTAISGKVNIDNEEFPFDGFVNITGKLSLGEVNNSKDITIYKEKIRNPSDYEES